MADNFLVYNPPSKVFVIFFFLAVLCGMWYLEFTDRETNPFPALDR